MTIILDQRVRVKRKAFGKSKECKSERIGYIETEIKKYYGSLFII